MWVFYHEVTSAASAQGDWPIAALCLSVAAAFWIAFTRWASNESR